MKSSLSNFLALGVASSLTIGSAVVGLYQSTGNQGGSSYSIESADSPFGSRKLPDLEGISPDSTPSSETQNETTSETLLGTVDAEDLDNNLSNNSDEAATQNETAETGADSTNGATASEQATIPTNGTTITNEETTSIILTVPNSLLTESSVTSSPETSSTEPTSASTSAEETNSSKTLVLNEGPTSTSLLAETTEPQSDPNSVPQNTEVDGTTPTVEATTEETTSAEQSTTEEGTTEEGTTNTGAPTDIDPSSTELPDIDGPHGWVLKYYSTSTYTGWAVIGYYRGEDTGLIYWLDRAIPTDVEPTGTIDVTSVPEIPLDAEATEISATDSSAATEDPESSASEEEKENNENSTEDSTEISNEVIPSTDASESGIID